LDGEAKELQPVLFKTKAVDIQKTKKAKGEKKTQVRASEKRKHHQTKHATPDKVHCTACLDGKFDRRPFTSFTSRRQYPLDLVYSDICGPMEAPLLGGRRYFILFIDDAT
jgi:hypothetical protein